jgi:hypothetical protein
VEHHPGLLTELQGSLERLQETLDALRTGLDEQDTRMEAIKLQVDELREWQRKAHERIESLITVTEQRWGKPPQHCSKCYRRITAVNGKCTNCGG